MHYRYDDELDKFFDQAYEHYNARRGENTVQKKRLKRNHSNDAMDLHEVYISNNLINLLVFIPSW